MGAHSLLQDTLQRVTGAPFAPVRVVCGALHADAVARQVSAPQLVEPMPRGTAAAILAAALAIGDRSALVLALPADHVVARPAALRAAVRAALGAARRGALITFGITADRPETGYGWIRPGAPLDGAVLRVERFLEKPDPATAAALLSTGGHLWNSGMFLFQVGALVDELQQLAPELLSAVLRAVQGATRGPADAAGGPARIALDPGAFGTAPSGSFDVVVMERTRRAAVIPVELGWDDVGTWEAVHRLSPADPQGSVIRGGIRAQGVRGCYLDGDATPVVVCGVEDVVVVARSEGILVCGRDSTQQVGALAAELPPRAWRAQEHRLQAGQRLQLGSATVVQGCVAGADGLRRGVGEGVTGGVVAVEDSVLVEVIPRAAG